MIKGWGEKDENFIKVLWCHLLSDRVFIHRAKERNSHRIKSTSNQLGHRCICPKFLSKPSLNYRKIPVLYRESKEL